MNLFEKARTFFAFTVAVILIVWIANHVALPVLLKYASVKAVSYADQRLRSQKAGSVEASFGEVEAEMPGRILWKDIKVRVGAGSGEGDLSLVRGTWQIRQAGMTIKDLFGGAFLFKVEGLRFEPEASGRFTEAVELADESAFIYVTIAPWDLLEGLSRPRALVKDLLKNGTISLPVKLSGGISFLMKGAEIRVRFSLVERNGKQALEIDPEDLRQVADHMGESVTDEEVEVMSRHPLKTLSVMRIKNQARGTAKSLFGKDIPQENWKEKRAAKILESRYRHILFSYQLTRAFGPEFAKQLTDAREVGSDHDAAWERVLDHQDNRWAREKALKGYSEKEIQEEFMRQETAKMIKGPNVAEPTDATGAVPARSLATPGPEAVASPERPSGPVSVKTGE